MRKIKDEHEQQDMHFKEVQDQVNEIKDTQQRNAEQLNAVQSQVTQILGLLQKMSTTTIVERCSNAG
eukprot:COSAG01_NODE_31397_length_598_cov_1.517034_1_plen_67_part_00